MNEITKKIQGLYNNPELIQKMRLTMTPQKIELFKTSILSIVSSNQSWDGVDAVSIISSALISATLDLPINQNLGFAYILPYNDRKLGKVAQFQIGYKGLIQLAIRSGQYKTISVCPIFVNQIISNNPLKGLDLDFNIAEKGDLYGYCAYFALTNGFEKYHLMKIEDLKNHSKNYSQSAKKGFGIWFDNFEAMAQKTVLKLLLSKFGILSVELEKAVLLDQSVINDNNVDYIDNFSTNQTNTRSELHQYIVNEVDTLDNLIKIENQLKTDEEKNAFEEKKAELQSTTVDIIDTDNTVIDD